MDLVREKDTGKSKGFAFLKYYDQRSTVLAVDNFNGITVAGRLLKVDHCKNYREKRPPRDDDEEEYKRKHSRLQDEKRKAFQHVDEASKDDLKRNHRDNRDKKEEEGEEDLYLKRKREHLGRKEGQKRREIDEETMEAIAKDLGLDEDDPMKEYLVRKELKKRRKREKEGDKFKS